MNEVTFADVAGRDMTGEKYENRLVMEGRSMTSLKGAPLMAKRVFSVKNNLLTSLEFGPKFVHGFYDASKNKLTSLKGCPMSGSNFYFDDNELTDLVGAPEGCGGNFYVSNNKLTSLKGCPEVIDGDFDIIDNKFTSKEQIIDEIMKYTKAISGTIRTDFGNFKVTQDDREDYKKKKLGKFKDFLDL